MSDPSVTECPSDESGGEDDVEPKLKYARLGSDVQRILTTSSATCIAVHSKLICVGSHWGAVHLLDHQGNNIRSRQLRAHTVAVNHISIDANGEYVATCSDDGMVFVHGLFAKEHFVSVNVGRLVKTVALDPLYLRHGNNRRFVVGDDHLTLYERTFLGNLKPTVLCESEGLVRSLEWGGNFLAWSSDIGVRVYDMTARCSLGLIKWEQRKGGATTTNGGSSTEGHGIEQFRCNLRWADARTLLIGWVDTVRVCIIRKRSSFELAQRDLPEFLVDPVSTFQTEFYISGIAPLDHQLVLLGFPKERDMNRKSLRPQLYIVEYRDSDYSDICTDSLSLRGYEDYAVNDYHLEVLLDENRFFIVAPKDIVIASPYDLDDRIAWFIQHSKYEEALDILMHNTSSTVNNTTTTTPTTATSPPAHSRACAHTVQTVGVAYLDHLLKRERYDEAAQLCKRIFGTDAQLWEEHVYKFAQVTRLRAVSAYVPARSAHSDQSAGLSPSPTLNAHIYEMILYEYLKLDAVGFLRTVKEWNCQLYNVSTMVNAVLEHLLGSDQDKNVYLEALALLYSYQKRYDKSLAMYLKLKNKDVFALIQKHELYDVIKDMLLELMELDYKQTVDLILEKNTISSDVVVETLKTNKLHLYRYLDEYDKRNPKGKYHKQLVELYAIFARDKLLPFLKKSDHYPIQHALDVCQKERFYPEMVYLLGRMGDTKEALELIMTELKDMQQAIGFCREHDDADLWNDLVAHALDKPEYVTFLLQSIGTYVDPTVLVQSIKQAMEIPGLKNSLVTMLNQYNLQVSVQEGCKKILVSDYFDLLDKLVRTQQRGIHVDEQMVCGACHHSIVETDAHRVADVSIYNCKHVFHESCLPPERQCDQCPVCYPSAADK